MMYDEFWREGDDELPPPTDDYAWSHEDALDDEDDEYLYFGRQSLIEDLINGSWDIDWEQDNSNEGNDNDSDSDETE